MIEIRNLGLEGVVEIVPRRFADERGFFSETYNRARLVDAGIETAFVQDNHSYSVHRGVLRGLHYQLPPRAQSKLLRVTRGAIFDVAVDIRRSSATFGQWVGAEVTAQRWNQILIPEGFAHGFLTLSDDTEVVYKVSDVYSPEHERSILASDPQLGIAWPGTGNYLLSEKDRLAPLLADAEVFA